jgi:hypothetical protein
MDDFLAPIQDAFEGQIVSLGHLAFTPSYLVLVTRQR